MAFFPWGGVLRGFPAAALPDEKNPHLGIGHAIVPSTIRGWESDKKFFFLIISVF
jgi:hypothetical protein